MHILRVIILGAAISLIIALLLSRTKAEAHDIYTQWTDENGTSCCNKQDCRPVKWRAGKTGGIEMYVEGTWISIPKKKLGQSPDNRAHWCGVNNWDSPGFTTLCARLPGGMS